MTPRSPAQMSLVPDDEDQAARLDQFRVAHPDVPDMRHDVTWVQRTPVGASAVARELAAALDDRSRALGERLAASPEPWLARQLGVLAPHASPALRAEYTPRAGIAAAYREAAGITNPDQAVSPELHRGNPNSKPRAKPSSPPWKYATKLTSSGA